MSNILDILNNENKLCYIMGDFNINLFNHEVHAPTCNFLNLMFLHSYIPLINKPTRVTNQSATLIDNIFTNNHKNMLQGIMYTDISDHFPIFLIDNNGKLTNNLKYTTNRNFSQANIDTFYNNMQNLDWDIMTYTNNCQTAYSVFYKSLLREYNDCFPIKTIKLNYKNRKPWLTYGLKNSIKEEK